MPVASTVRLRHWYRTLADSFRIEPRRPRLTGISEVLAPRACPVVHLEGFADVPVLHPGLSFYLDLIAQGEGFAFVKRMHGFWDGLQFLRETVPQIDARVSGGARVGARVVRDALSRTDVAVSVEERSGFVNHFRDQFYTELVEDLQAPLAMPGYIEGSAFRGYPNSDACPALHPVDRLREVYHAFHTSGRPAHDAQVWKQAILDGTFWDVAKAISEMPMLLIGPPHLSTLGRHLGQPRFHHVVIPPVGAPLERRPLLERCSELLCNMSRDGRPIAVLYQAGALAYWLIYRLFPLAPHTFHLDLGRCLDVWYPEVVCSQPWFLENRERIIANMRLDHLHN